MSKVIHKGACFEGEEREWRFLSAQERRKKAKFPRKEIRDPSKLASTVHPGIVSRAMTAYSWRLAEW